MRLALQRESLNLRMPIEEFVLGYENKHGPLERPLFQSSVVAGILRCLPHAFRRGEPNWPSMMYEMIEYASDWCPQNLSTTPIRSALGCNKHESSGLEIVEPTDFAENQECARYLSTKELKQQWSDGEFYSSELLEAKVDSVRLLRHKPGRRLLIEHRLTLQSGGNIADDW